VCEYKSRERERERESERERMCRGVALALSHQESEVPPETLIVVSTTI